MQNHVIYLNVHPDEYWKARKAGADYSKRWKACYTHAHHDNTRLKRWLPRQYHPDHSAPYLSINLIPETSFHKNLHKLFLNPKEWDLLRREIYRRAGYRCEICGGRGGDHPVECNEHWEFSDPAVPNAPKIQKLARLEALCPDCHKCIHFGDTIGRGKAPIAYQQFQLVNGWSSEDTDAAHARAKELWRERSKHQWTFDLSHLNSYGIDALIPDRSKAQDWPEVIGVRVEWKAVQPQPKPAIPFAQPVPEIYALKTRAIAAAPKPSWLMQAIQSLRNDWLNIRRWTRRNIWFLASAAIGGLLAAHHYGYTKGALEELSLGLRYAYWYVEELKR